MKLTNEHGIHISMAVFLAYDNYDYDGRENSISTTGLLNSPRQSVLSKKAVTLEGETDIYSFMASSVGTAMHDGIEAAWKNGYKMALGRLGYPQAMINRVRINPDPKNLTPDTIPIYIENRREKVIDGVIVTGKYDFIAEGQLTDHKTTGVYGFMKGNNDDKHRIQGSIYRWLNQDIITNDTMLINYIFTDWSALRAMIEEKKGYPQKRTLIHPIELLSIAQTESFISQRIAAIKTTSHLPEKDMPYCTQEELWQDDPVYKYYKNPKSTTRSTRNFDNYHEAQAQLIKDGSVGTIKTVIGKVKRCKYCAGFPLCSQAQDLVAKGLIDLED